MTQMLSLFAVLLGTGGLLSQASGGGALFTLSLPVSRKRLLGVRAATGLAELLALAFVPPLLLPLLSPAVGQSYGIGDALVHGACLVRRGDGAVQPGLPAVHGLRRRWRAADRLQRRRRARHRRAVLRRARRATACSGSWTARPISAVADCRGWDCSPARRCRRRCCSPRAETSRARISDAPLSRDRRSVHANAVCTHMHAPPHRRRRCSLVPVPPLLAQTAGRSVRPLDRRHPRAGLQRRRFARNRHRDRSREERRRRARRPRSASPIRTSRGCRSATSRSTARRCRSSSRRTAAALFHGTLSRRDVDRRRVHHHRRRLRDPVQPDAHRRRADGGGAEERGHRQGARGHVERRHRRRAANRNASS